MSNPYLNDDADADIFEAEGGQNENVEHILQGPNGEELPDEVKEYLNQNSKGNFKLNDPSQIPPEFIVMGEMFSFLGQYRENVPEGPLLLALTEVLGELGKGDALKKWYDYYEAKREILYTHMVLKVINAISHLIVIDPEGHQWHTAELKEYMNTYAKLITFIQDKAKALYVSLSVELGQKIDQQFLDGGQYSSRTQFEAIAMCNPPADEHIE